MNNHIQYTYAAPLPKAENMVFSALVECGGQATAAELHHVIKNETGLALIYTLTARLEKKGLLTRQQREYDLGPLGKGSRTTYVITNQEQIKGTPSMVNTEPKCDEATRAYQAIQSSTEGACVT
jgi:predicted transcriptional regulator